MRRGASITIVALILIGAAVYGIQKGNNDTSSAPNVTSSQTNTTPAPKEQPVAADKVSIQNYSFTPAAITIKMGTHVTWTNDDTVPHTVTESDGQNGPNSSDLAPGKSYSFTFNQTGTFKYRCNLHTDMTGTVTVTE